MYSRLCHYMSTDTAMGTVIASIYICKTGFTHTSKDTSIYRDVNMHREKDEVIRDRKSKKKRSQQQHTFI